MVIEVVNRTLDALLRATIGKDLRDWDNCLPIMEFSYNRLVHNTTRKTPFNIVYVFNPNISLNLLLKHPINEYS